MWEGQEMVKILQSHESMAQSKWFVTILVLIISSSALIISGCMANTDTKPASYTDVNGSSIQKIEVIHFHATQQCISCVMLGQYAEETVNTYFSKELESGKITFDHINYDLPQNNGLVVKYGVTGSSLWLGVYDENGFHKEENINVWYKLNNKQDFMNYLTEHIEKRLSGDFS
jgi:frataxin-like iron-binding protein CyaY